MKTPLKQSAWNGWTISLGISVLSLVGIAIISVLTYQQSLKVDLNSTVVQTVNLTETLNETLAN